MGLLEETFAKIKPLDEEAIVKAGKRQDSLTKPPGSLGRLEDMVKLYAGITGQSIPEIPRKCMLLFAADHGVAKRGISAYPVETTIHMTRNYLLAKGSGANALANFCGADLVVTDVGVAGELGDVPGLLSRKVAYGTADFTQGPAMTREQAVQAIEVGLAVVRAQLDKGYRCFSLGEMGIGNTTISAAITAAYTGISPEQATVEGRESRTVACRSRLMRFARRWRSTVPIPRMGWMS